MAFDTTHDITPDSPTNTFATWNVLVPTNGTFSEGNTLFTASSSAPSTTSATISMTSGKWYCEILYKGVNGWTVGIVADTRTRNYLGMSDSSTSVSIWPYTSATDVYVNGASISWSGSATTWANEDIVSMLVDANVQSITFYKNGTSIGAVSYSSYGWDTAYFAVGNYVAGTDYHVNFGQDPTFGGSKNTPATVTIDGQSVTGPFAPSGTAAGTAGLFYYPPPADALALCTANLPDPDIDPNADDLPEDYFKAVKYDGDGSNSRNITAVGFQPDFVWVKSRSLPSAANIVDSVRGSGYRIRPDDTSIELYQSPYGYISGFLSNGFTVAKGSSTDSTYTGWYETNQSSQTYVAWCWKAGGAPTTDNTATSGAMTANSVSVDGTLQSSYTPSGSPTIYPKRMSVNTKAGFSIIKYTGTGSAATVPHGLSAAPELILIKELTQSRSWTVYHKDVGATAYLQLDTTVTSNPSSAVFNNNSPTNNVFSLGTSIGTNQNTEDYIAYCWHSVAGYSAFGSYTGNGSADGPFVYTGFKPAWLMIKNIDNSGHWPILDNKRGPYNVNGQFLAANLSNDESYESTRQADFLSNGFKIRGTSSVNFDVNNTDDTYIYACFAEMPFRYSATNAR